MLKKIIIAAVLGILTILAMYGVAWVQVNSDPTMPGKFFGGGIDEE